MGHRALSWAEHQAVNARVYPGTRQLCIACNQPTERCEEDAMYEENGRGPLCLDCWHQSPEYDPNGGA